MDKCRLCPEPIMGGYAGGLCKSCWDSLLDDDEQPAPDQVLHTFDSHFCQKCQTLCSATRWPEAFGCVCWRTLVDDQADYPKSWVEVEVEIREKHG